eukprot:305099-Rhodomonas_salina.1
MTEAVASQLQVRSGLCSANEGMRAVESALAECEGRQRKRVLDAEGFECGIKKARKHEEEEDARKRRRRSKERRRKKRKEEGGRVAHAEGLHHRLEPVLEARKVHLPAHLARQNRPHCSCPLARP